MSVLVSLALALALAYLAWPYTTVWQLDRALKRDDRDALAALVDLEAIRGAILRRVNKDSERPLAPPSDAFIDWLEQGIRRNGKAVLTRQIDLDWVRERLLAHSPHGGGLTPRLTRAFFDTPLRFSLRIGAPGMAPVWAILSFRGTGWRVTAVYY